MRLLVLVDVANFRSSAGQHIHNPRDLWYAAVGNVIAGRVQTRLKKRVSDVEVRLYIGRTDKKTVDRLVEDKLLTDSGAERLLSETRLVGNEDKPEFALPGVRVVLRSFVKHKGHWTTYRVRLPADDKPNTKNFVYVRQKAAEVREKGADTMLAFDIAAASASGQCDVLVVCTEDTDQQPTLSQAGALAERSGHSLKVFNAFPGAVEARWTAVGAQNCSQITLLPDDLRQCAVFANKANRQANAPASYTTADGFGP